ncbi:MAG: site-specific DNA-methyltransferase [Promethearchaeota archaeon]
MTQETFKIKFLELFKFDNLDAQSGIFKILEFKKQKIQNLINDLIPLILAEEEPNKIFFYLLEFFSKYYNKGFFYESEKTVIPFQEEPILLHWANKYQFYVKTLSQSQAPGKKLIHDYYIHKDLQEVLKKELGFFVRNEVIGIEETNELDVGILKGSFKRAKTMKKFALQIIELLNQIELFQLKLWNKIPLILKTDYVISLDKLEEYAGENFLKKNKTKILNNKKQVKEWNKIFKTTIDNITNISEREGILNKKFKSLPIDTSNFDEEFKWDLISEISQNNNLDKVLDGVLIKSNNFQALNLIRKKWCERVNLIYLDPPFNTGKDEILYKNDFLGSSWLVMMFNRLLQAKNILNKQGCIFVRIDNHGNHYTRFLLDMVFGKSNFRNEIILNKTRAKQQRKKPFIQQTESLFFYSVTDEYVFNQLFVPRREPKWYELLDFPRSNETPRIILGKKYYPPKNRRWGLSQERIDEFEQKGKIRINIDKSYIDCFGNTINEKPELFYDEEPVRNDWLDIPGYSQVHKFSTENSEELLQRVIESGSKERDTVLDFFLGSGTTIAAAHKLNRKWIGVEFGTQFEDFVLPRMKMVLMGDKSGISKTTDVKKAGFYKYHYLEQFEDSIENIVIELQKNGEDPQFNEIKNPFRHQQKIIENSEFKIVNVDLIESFNYVMGVLVDKMANIKDNGRIYIIITGRIEKDKVGIIWRETSNIDLELDKKIIEENLNNANIDLLYVNGRCLVKGAKPIEAELNHVIKP